VIGLIGDDFGVAGQDVGEAVHLGRQGGLRVVRIVISIEFGVRHRLLAERVTSVDRVDRNRLLGDGRAVVAVDEEREHIVVLGVHVLVVFVRGENVAEGDLGGSRNEVELEDGGIGGHEAGQSIQIRVARRLVLPGDVVVKVYRPFNVEDDAGS
jgi:hypothetical protein